MADWGLLLLRVGAGGGMLFGHGLGKLIGFAEKSAQFPDPLGVGSPVSLGLAIFAEVFCAAAVALGVVTRYALVPLLITMGVAFFLIHGGDPWGKKEMSGLYFVMFGTLMLTGPGRYALKR